MQLPKEIQNLILIRYYFNQWKEKIEQVNLQYQALFSIKNCADESCMDKSCKEIFIRCQGNNYNTFQFNYRKCQLDKDHFHQDPIYSFKLWMKDDLKTLGNIAVGKLPKKYYFSSGEPNPENLYDYLFGRRNAYKYNCP